LAAIASSSHLNLSAYSLKDVEQHSESKKHCLPFSGKDTMNMMQTLNYFTGLILVFPHLGTT
jgi:hypothetical protein